MGEFDQKFNALSNSFSANFENGNLTKKLIRAKLKHKRQTRGPGIMDVVLGAVCPLIPTYRFGGMLVHKITGK